MNRRFHSRSFKALFPFFLLALAVLAVWEVFGHFETFLGALGWLWGVVTPFFYGFLLAYVINIPVGGIQRLLERTKIRFVVRRQRALSIVLVFILLLLFLALVSSLVVPALVSSISLFISNFPAYYENAMGLIQRINDMDLFGLYINPDTITEMFQGLTLENILLPVNTLIGVSTAIFGGIFVVFLTLVSSIYFLIEKEKAKAYLQRLLRAFLSAGVFDAILKYTVSLNQSFKQYIRVQTIDSLILGTIVTIQLWIMGSPFALLLGIMLGILNYIPYFGSIIGTIVAVLVVAFTQSLNMGLIAAVVLVITQQIDANIIQPRLMGGSFKMSPLLIIISITIGGAIAGILGMIAAIPIVSVLRDMLENVLAYYERKKLAGSVSEAADDKPAEPEE